MSMSPAGTYRPPASGRNMVSVRVLAQWFAQDTTQLSVSRGDQLQVSQRELDEGKDWLLATNSAGNRGFVPAAHIEA